MSRTIRALLYLLLFCLIGAAGFALVALIVAGFKRLG